MSLNLKGRQPPTYPVTKGFRLSRAQARALEHFAEQEEVDEAVIIRFCLEQLPGWGVLVARFEVEERSKANPGGKQRRGRKAQKAKA